ncbi:MAG: riboflavin synthase [Bacteroidia bacterium]|nr:riboflavin synthase [Bacteroidia bacterium]NNC84760.1 riboflavin synthase [Bacteroidia bacterium]NNM16394.1 riboflavin synthase [Bacteroidia bacterium]
MFTGIIETLAKVEKISPNQSNIDISLSSSITHELKIDQSVSHNGVCLTVTTIDGDIYTVTAIKETLEKSNIGKLQTGDLVNIERSLKIGDRLDGHMVQGHVDSTAICENITEEAGSWLFEFKYINPKSYLVVDKGSICVNGVSLTVVKQNAQGFSVAIIPYTYEHTNFKQFKKGTIVNIEFDVIGKYIAQLNREKPYQVN